MVYLSLLCWSHALRSDQHGCHIILIVYLWVSGGKPRWWCLSMPSLAHLSPGCSQFSSGPSLLRTLVQSSIFAVVGLMLKTHYNGSWTIKMGWRSQFWFLQWLLMCKKHRIQQPKPLKVQKLLPLPHHFNWVLAPHFCMRWLLHQLDIEFNIVCLGLKCRVAYNF